MKAKNPFDPQWPAQPDWITSRPARAITPQMYWCAQLPSKKGGINPKRKENENVSATASMTKFRQENDTFGRNLLKLCICNNILLLKLLTKDNTSHGAVAIHTPTHNNGPAALYPLLTMTNGWLRQFSSVFVFLFLHRIYSGDPWAHWMTQVQALKSSSSSESPDSLRGRKDCVSIKARCLMYLLILTVRGKHQARFSPTLVWKKHETDTQLKTMETNTRMQNYIPMFIAITSRNNNDASNTVLPCQCSITGFKWAMGLRRT